jgi:hypothetical protein
MLPFAPPELKWVRIDDEIAQIFGVNLASRFKNCNMKMWLALNSQPHFCIWTGDEITYRLCIQGSEKSEPESLGIMLKSFQEAADYAREISNQEDRNGTGN